MKTLLNILSGSMLMAPTWAVLLILAGAACAYSERMNPGYGHGGPWLDVVAGVLAAIGVVSIAASVANSK